MNEIVASNDEKDLAIKLAQDCVTDVPVMIVGSGASCAHGIRGMGELAEFLIKNVTPDSGDESAWTEFKNELEQNTDLEEALHRVSISSSLLKEIVCHTQRMIVEDETPIYHKVIANELTLGLSALYKHMFNTTHKVIDVVTTNYDRLAEYAASQARYRCNTGFTDGTIRHFKCERSNPANYSRAFNFRCVDIWKVHGSVDWFEDSLSQPVGLLDAPLLPDGFRSLVITPGVSKYLTTHQEPYRTVIACADQALSSARSFFCIGYGFSDLHIEPKLIQRSIELRCPILILARSLRPGAKEFLDKHMHSKVIAFEKSGNDTRAFMSGAKDGVLIKNENLWSLEGLLTQLGVME